jgi:hypothetical protein
MYDEIQDERECVGSVPSTWEVIETNTPSERGRENSGVGGRIGEMSHTHNESRNTGNVINTMLRHKLSIYSNTSTGNASLIPYTPRSKSVGSPLHGQTTTKYRNRVKPSTSQLQQLTSEV